MILLVDPKTSHLFSFKISLFLLNSILPIAIYLLENAVTLPITPANPMFANGSLPCSLYYNFYLLNLKIKYLE
jgi:hypothetical protein